MVFAEHIRAISSLALVLCGVSWCQPSDRVTAEKVELADVLEGPSSLEERRDMDSKLDDINAYFELPKHNTRARQRHPERQRRETADFSSLQSLLDSSTASEASPNRPGQEDDAGEQLPGRRSAEEHSADGRLVDMEDGGGDETSDFSSLMALVQSEGAGANSQARSSAEEHRGGRGTEGDPKSPGTWMERAAALRPRAPHRSNQKPGRANDESRPVPPPSVPLAVGAGARGIGKGASAAVPGPASVNPRSPARRPKRSMSLDPAVAAAVPTAWEVVALPASNAVGVRCVILRTCLHVISNTFFSSVSLLFQYVLHVRTYAVPFSK